MKRHSLTAVLIVAGIFFLTMAAFAQRGGRNRGFGGGFGGRPDSGSAEIPVKDAEFNFIRVEYTDYNRGRGFFGSRSGSAGGWWAQDWPDAEEHFTFGVKRLTRIDTGDPRHMRLTDERIFNYPWIYATQTGYWQLSDAECAALREYLFRGGFIVTDDFWGQDEWEAFAQTMDRVLPGRPIPDIAETDSVMHVLYDIQAKDRTFIPGSRHLQNYGGKVQIVQPQGTQPAWRAMFDDKQRMVVAVNYDTDVADAWEFADVPYYPEAMTTLAYRYGINYLIYSMTH